MAQCLENMGECSVVVILVRLASPLVQLDVPHGLDRSPVLGSERSVASRLAMVVVALSSSALRGRDRGTEKLGLSAWICVPQGGCEGAEGIGVVGSRVSEAMVRRGTLYGQIQQESRETKRQGSAQGTEALGCLEANGQVHQKKVDTPQVEGACGGNAAGRSPVADRGSSNLAWDFPCNNYGLGEMQHPRYPSIEVSYPRVDKFLHYVYTTCR